MFMFLVFMLNTLFFSLINFNGDTHSVSNENEMRGEVEKKRERTNFNVNFLFLGNYSTKINE